MESKVKPECLGSQPGLGVLRKRTIGCVLGVMAPLKCGNRSAVCLSWWQGTGSQVWLCSARAAELRRSKRTQLRSQSPKGPFQWSLVASQMGVRPALSFASVRVAI